MSDDDRKRPGQVVAEWWRDLHPRDDGAGGDRATAARLRRAGTLHQVMAVPEAMRLYRTLCDALARERLSESEAGGVAILAGVLATVKPGRPDTTFATMLGRNADGKQLGQHERPLFSSQRFAALIRADDPEERLRHLRRAAALARDKSFNVARFAEDVLWWNDATRGRWIFEYHQEGRAAPAADDTEPQEGTAQ